MIDVVTFGEAMIRLTPPDFQKIEQAAQFNANAGGAELNVAVSLAILGLKSQWISKLPQNSMGKLVKNKASEYGVNTDHIAWDTSGRLGLYYYEKGASPRPSSVIYDRAHSSFTNIKKNDFNYKNILNNIKWFHTTGITPALGKGCTETAIEFLKTAKKTECMTSYDLNYRKKLWTQEEAKKIQEPMMEFIDILISTEEDIERVFNIKNKNNDYKKISEKLIEKYNLKMVCITIRENISVWKNNWSAVLYDGSTFYNSNKWEVEIVDRIGGGDSFTAGLIYGLLSNKNTLDALNFAVASSALKHSIPGDFNLTTKEEVENLLKNKNLRVQR